VAAGTTNGYFVSPEPESLNVADVNVVPDHELTVEIADGVKVRVHRALISSVLSKTEPVNDDKKPAGGDKAAEGSGGVGGFLGGLFGGKK